VAGSTVTATPAVTVLRRLEQLGARQRRQLGDMPDCNPSTVAHAMAWRDTSSRCIQAGIEIEVEMQVDIEVEASGDACPAEDQVEGHNRNLRARLGSPGVRAAIRP